MNGTRVCLGLKQFARAIRRPWVSLLFFVMLWVDACTLPRGSTVGNFVSIAAIGCRCYWGADVRIIESNGGLWLSTGDENEPAYREDEVLADVSCQPRRFSRGFWAITSHSWNPAVQIYTEREITDAQEVQIRRVFADWLEREQMATLPEYAQLVRVGHTGRITEVVLGGYVHNAVASMLAMCFVASLGWIHDRIRSGRMRQRLRLGRCPECTYELRGDLAAGCPECGWGRGVRTGV